MNTNDRMRAVSPDDLAESDGPDEGVLRLEIYGILVLSFSLALFASLMTFDPADVAQETSTRTREVHNAIGPIGAHIANVFLDIMGMGSFAVTGIFAFLGGSYLIGRKTQFTGIDVLGWIGILSSVTILLHVILSPAMPLGHPPGGDAGAYVGEVCRAFLSTPGTLLLTITILVISLVALTRRSVFELARGLKARVRQVVSFVKQGRNRSAEATEPAHTEAPGNASDVEPLFEAKDVGKPESTEPESETVALKIHEPTEPGFVEPIEVLMPDEALVGQVLELEPPPLPNAKPKETVKPAQKAVAKKAPEEPPTPESSTEEDDLKIVESAAMRRRPDLTEQGALELGEVETANYEFPSLQLITYKAPDGCAFNAEILRKNAQLLEAKLADYKVQGNVVEIHPGPVITMYEFLPAPGVKISKIANLSDDLAMALSALKIRIVAPIPGKNVVGIEVPNTSREIVWLKEVLSDSGYSQAKSKLTLALGKDIVGNPTSMALEKAPHVLVAGATGSGKSVAINSFIVSLLYKATPDDVRMIMVDPKMIELSIYEGIPHLLLPVVTDPKQAAVALRWAVREMERRYRLLADVGARNLASYNTKIDALLAAENPTLPERLRLAKVKREAKGEFDPEGVLLDSMGKPLARLPKIVVIIDELADLMMVASKDVEMSIARLAQKARAAGIHLILATQRPSVDVITGVIKANLPTRISFLVASKIDSRTILDQSGAENLLGMGDMLYMAPGTSNVQRVHGCFITEEEVHRIVDHVKTQGKPDYDLGILVSDDEDGDGTGPARDGDDYDELYDRAVRIVAEARNASISFLQRKLKIGYNRSARIIEKMEEEGIVGPSDGTSRPREVFIDPI